MIKWGSALERVALIIRDRCRHVAMDGSNCPRPQVWSAYLAFHTWGTVSVFDHYHVPDMVVKRGTARVGLAMTPFGVARVIFSEITEVMRELVES